MPSRDNTFYRQVPPLAPDQAYQYNQQLQNLYGSFWDTVAQLRYSQAQSAGTFREQMSQIRQAEGQNLSDAEASAIERGSLGSSTDLFQTRTGVRADAATAAQGARGQRFQSTADAKFQIAMAKRMLEQGLISAETYASISKSVDAINNFTNDTVPGGGTGGGGGGGGVADAALPPHAHHRLNALHDHILQLLKLYGSTGHTGDTEQSLSALWHRRNLLRKKYGLAGIPRSKLTHLLANSGGSSPYGHQQA